MADSNRTQISLRVPNALIDDLDRIAAALDRDRTWVLLHAFQFYRDREGSEILTDAAGIAAVNRGETLAWSDAKAQIDEAITRGTVTHVKKAG